MHILTLTDAKVLIIQVNTVKEESHLPLQLTTHELKPMSVTRPMRHRTSSIIIFDDQTPSWPNLETQMSSLDLATPLLEVPGVSASNWESAKPYRPPTFSERYKNESEVPPPVIKDSLVIEDFPVGQVSTAWINMVKQGLSEWIRIPVIVARGKEPG